MRALSVLCRFMFCIYLIFCRIKCIFQTHSFVTIQLKGIIEIRKTQLCCLSVPRRRDNSPIFRRRSLTALRRNTFTLCEETEETRRNKEECWGTHLPVALPDRRSTTSYTLRDDTPDPRGSRGVFRKSTGKPRELTRVLQRRLPSTFVTLAAFIDGKSVADLRSRISVEKPEERCHFSRRDCRCYMPHGKICRKMKIRSTNFAEISCSVSRRCRDASSHTSA